MARTNVRINLTPGQALENLATIIERKVTSVAMDVQRTATDSISIGQPVRRTKRGYLVGLNPSAEGEPPHVLYSRLYDSIVSEVKREAHRIVAKIGTNVKYAHRLEMGFVGQDSLGRNVHQGPRPFLRPALDKELKSFTTS
jgi:phage gpG-like protein